MPELGQGEVDERAAVLRLGDVGRQGAHRGIRGRQVGRDVFQAIGPPPGEDHLPADGGDRVGEADAEAGCRAGDDDDLAIEAERLEGIHRGLRGPLIWAPGTVRSLTATRSKTIMLFSDR